MRLLPIRRTRSPGHDASSTAAIAILTPLLIGLLLAACTDDVIAPPGQEPPPEASPLVVGDVDVPGVDVRIPDDPTIGFEVSSQGDLRVDEEAGIDLDGDGEANLVITRLRLLEDGQQLVVVRTRPGVLLAVRPDVMEEVPPGLEVGGSPLLRAPRVFRPGDVLQRDAQIWAEGEDLFAAHVIRNTIWMPSGFRLTGESNHLGFRIGDRLGWVELGVALDPSLQVESLELRQVGLRVAPEEG